MVPNNPRDMMSAVSDSMKERTGHTVEAWVAIVRRSGTDPLDQAAVRHWLKQEHGVPQNSRWAIADAAARDAGWTPPSLDEQIDRQYAGDKAPLRRIFDRLRSTLESFGDDVAVEPRGTYIPFVRRRQFAAVAAATKTRVDVGLRYVEAPRSPRLTPANAPGQATHRLSLTSAEEVDGEVEELLREAYRQNG